MKEKIGSVQAGQHADIAPFQQTVQIIAIVLGKMAIKGMGISSLLAEKRTAENSAKQHQTGGCGKSAFQITSRIYCDILV
jgi:hypothetical protein